MGLTYHYKFRASPDNTPEELERFLRNVEQDAKRLGFSPTMVLDAPFDTPERRQFARRLTHGLILESEGLKTAPGLGDDQVWHFNPIEGSCRVIPERGVVLVVTDEQRCETIFGFFKYPAWLKDENGRDIIQTGAETGWVFEDFIKTPDPRFRTLVKRFAEAGFVEQERDDFSRP
jgi:hypothetical protein